jgi:probable phosphoglycerate mutase
MRLFLVRHGQTAWNLDRRLQGHTDIELDETGLLQAEQVGRAFRGVEVGRLLTSDLARCHGTAVQIGRALGLEPEVDPCLKERCFGTMEGSRFEDFHTALESKVLQSGCSRLDFAPDGGESLRQVWDRLGRVADRLHAERAVVVSHGGTLGLLLARLIEAGPEAAQAFRFHNASVTELFKRPNGSWAIERLNDKSHLEVARERTGA